MAFVVENGSGLSTANSYVDLSFANGYHADRGNSTWSPLDDPVKQALLIKATDYLDAFYCYKGIISKSTQALQWPRTGVVDALGNAITGVPIAIKKATAELALEANSVDLVVNPADDVAGLPVKSVHDRVGEIERSIEFWARGNSIPRFPTVDGFLRFLVSGSSGGWNPRVSGISKSEMTGVREDDDRFPSKFRVGVMDRPEDQF